MSEYCIDCEHFFGRIAGGPSNPVVAKWCSKYGSQVDYALSTCERQSGKDVGNKKRELSMNKKVYPGHEEFKNAVDLFIMKKAASDAYAEAIKAMVEEYEIKSTVLNKAVSILVNDTEEEVREEVGSLIGILDAQG